MSPPVLPKFQLVGLGKSSCLLLCRYAGLNGGFGFRWFCFSMHSYVVKALLLDFPHRCDGLSVIMPGTLCLQVVCVCVCVCVRSCVRACVCVCVCVCVCFGCEYY